MQNWQLTTPVVFLVFNRPETTARVFEKIRQAAPEKLLIVADGARPDRPGEAGKVAAVREIVTQVDWPCEVLTDFSDVNLGCRRRVSSGLSWVFGQVEEAIILEDDCLPDPSFFRFCQELLERYRHDERVMMISGDNFQFGARRTQESYYFSRYPHIWGWATWRRSWNLYDVEIKGWPALRDGGWLRDLFPCRRVGDYWNEIFEAVYRGDIDAWAHQLTFSCLVNNALCVMPVVNMVSNIGFGADATHTTGEGRLAALPTQEMEFPLRHPGHMIRDARSDRLTDRDHTLAWRKRLQLLLRRLV